jgi:hypothetical protein
MIKIDIDIGDTILTGKWKNKKIVVKDIGVDDHGMPTINGKGITKIRKAKVKQTEDNRLARKNILDKMENE